MSHGRLHTSCGTGRAQLAPDFTFDRSIFNASHEEEQGWVAVNPVFLPVIYLMLGLEAVLFGCKESAVYDFVLGVAALLPLWLAHKQLLVITNAHRKFPG
jgi:hypothetical protein